MVSACHDKLVIPEDPEPQPRAEAERTVIVYMAADNSLSSAVRGDTAEMVWGKKLIPEDVNYIIYLDDKTHKPAIYELSAKSGIQLWKRYEEETCATDSFVMLDVLRQIEHYFPARHYGITFWSHASGWVPEQISTRRNTFGKDEDRGSSTSGKIEMEIPLLRNVLAQLPKFDYIFFDACFMQCIEVAYELRDVTDYMVGSPAEIPGPGAPYEKIIEALCKGDVKGIVEGYASGYPDTYSNFYYSGVLLSCIDCAHLEELAQATGQFLIPLYMGQKEHNRTDFQYYCSNLANYTYFFDMRTTMCRLLSEEDYAAWMELFDQAVPLYTLSSTLSWYANHCDYPRVKDPNCYSGVSMFIPLNKYESYGWNEAFRKTAWYKATGWQETGW